MGTGVKFEWDSRDLDIWRNNRTERALARALKRAGDEAARAMKAEGSRKVREKKRFKASRVNSSLPLTFPSSKDIARLAWRMGVSGALVPVSAFPHRQTRRGVTVEINRGSRKVIRSAFIATMRSGHGGVFMRKGEARLPIREAFTTRISDFFERDGGLIPAVQERAARVMDSAFSRCLAHELEEIKRTGG